MSNNILDEDELQEFVENFWNTNKEFYFLVTDANGWPHLLFESEDGELFATTIPTEDDDLNASSTHSVSGLTYPLTVKYANS